MRLHPGPLLAYGASKVLFSALVAGGLWEVKGCLLEGKLRQEMGCGGCLSISSEHLDLAIPEFP